MSDNKSNNQEDLDKNSLELLRKKLNELIKQLSNIDNVSENMKKEVCRISASISKIAEKSNAYNELRKSDKEYINAELSHLRNKIEEYSKTHHTAGQLSRDLIQLKRIITEIESTVDDLVFRVDEHLRTIDPAIGEHENSCAACRDDVNEKISKIIERIKTLETSNYAHEKFREQIKGAKSLIIIIGMLIAIVAGIAKVISSIPPQKEHSEGCADNNVQQIINEDKHN